MVEEVVNYYSLFLRVNTIFLRSYLMLLKIFEINCFTQNDSVMNMYESSPKGACNEMKNLTHPSA